MTILIIYQGDRHGLVFDEGKTEAAYIMIVYLDIRAYSLGASALLEVVHDVVEGGTDNQAAFRWGEDGTIHLFLDLAHIVDNQVPPKIAIPSMEGSCRMDSGDEFLAYRRRPKEATPPLRNGSLVLGKEGHSDVSQGQNGIAATPFDQINSVLGHRLARLSQPFVISPEHFPIRALDILGILRNHKGPDIHYVDLVP
jgi:hypothetical protein